MRAVNRSRAAALAAVLLALLTVGLLLGTPAAAATAGPEASIALSQDSGPPGTGVTVALACGSWDNGWDVSVDAFGAEPTRVHVDSGGPFPIPLSVPLDAPAGPTPIVATCTRSVPIGAPDPGARVRGATVPDPVVLTATFTVEQVVIAPPATIVPVPDHGSAGAQVRVTGDHLPACDQAGWTVVIGGSIQAPEVDDPVGPHAVFTVVVPAAAPVGPTVVALDCVGRPVARAAFRVTAVVTPTSPPKPPVQQPPVQQPPAQQPPAQQPPASPPQPTTVVVPDLSGLTLVQAASALTARQLALAAGGVPDRGVVTGQQPAAGTQVAPGTAVSVEQAAPASTSDLPGAVLGVLAVAAAAAVLRAQRTKAGREWARRHVRVVVGSGGGRR